MVNVDEQLQLSFTCDCQLLLFMWPRGQLLGMESAGKGANDNEPAYHATQCVDRDQCLGKNSLVETAECNNMNCKKLCY